MLGLIESDIIISIAIVVSIIVLVITVRATLALRGFDVEEARRQIAELHNDEIKDSEVENEL